MEPVHPLGELIKNVLDHSHPKLTGAEVARRAGLGPQHVHRLMHQPMKEMPTPDTLAKLAKGLGIDLAVVVRAALESLGLPVSGDPADDTRDIATKIRQLIANSYTMEPEERGRWLMLVTIAEHQRAEAEAEAKRQAEQSPKRRRAEG